jgi:hypothetical protein
MTLRADSSTSPKRFQRNDLVEILSRNEIRAVLDAEGKYEGLPFMPEMARYCGSQARVLRRVDRTCVEGYGLRQIHGTVFLEGLQCDGILHDGCQRECRFFWKDAWLKSATTVAAARRPISTEAAASDIGTLIWQCELPSRQGDRYVCQSTELYAATASLTRQRPSRLLRTLLYRSLHPRELLKTLIQRHLAVAVITSDGAAQGLPKTRSLDRPWLRGGEWVVVKHSDDIRRELSVSAGDAAPACQGALAASDNASGMDLGEAMVPYTGGTYQVDFPMEKFISERSGRMMFLRNTVVLKGVKCQGGCAGNCPRNSNLYWREDWLQRNEPHSDTGFPSVPQPRSIWMKR